MLLDIVWVYYLQHFLTTLFHLMPIAAWSNSVCVTGRPFLFFTLNSIILKSLKYLFFLPNSKGVINVNLLLINIATRILVTLGLEIGKKISCHAFFHDKQEVQHLSMLSCCMLFCIGFIVCLSKNWGNHLLFRMKSWRLVSELLLWRSTFSLTFIKPSFFLCHIASPFVHMCVVIQTNTHFEIIYIYYFLFSSSNASTHFLNRIQHAKTKSYPKDKTCVHMI